jgi:hypothetical protein
MDAQLYQSPDHPRPNQAGIKTAQMAHLPDHAGFSERSYCDVGSLVYYSLSGDLTIPLLLKIITIGVLAGGIFAYFIADQRKDETGS